MQAVIKEDELARCPCVYVQSLLLDLYVLLVHGWGSACKASDFGGLAYKQSFCQDQCRPCRHSSQMDPRSVGVMIVRQMLPGELAEAVSGHCWRLHPAMCQQHFSRIGKPLCSLFASTCAFS